MITADLHPQEPLRLAALLHYDVLDTGPEPHFDELTELASLICDTPISLVSLVDRDRQWFKSKVGLDADQTHRDIAFCSHAILQDDVFEVPDALQDERFSDNPLVTDAPDIRFYAGAPLVTSDGMPIGTLCVIDRSPKELDDKQRRALTIISNQVISQLELRLHNRKLEHLHRDSEHLFSLIAHDLRSPFNGILGLSRLLADTKQKLSTNDVSEFSQQILSSSLQVYQLLDEMLQWAQQRLSSKPVHSKTESLFYLIHETIKLTESAAQVKHLNVRLDISDPSIQAYCDAVITKTILRNLLNNAIKFSPADNDIVIGVREAGNKIVVNVVDKGPGIAESVRENLFQCAVESQASDSGEKGSGLGLSLCAEFSQAQGGEIWIESSDETGSNIAFSLPKQAHHTD